MKKFLKLVAVSSFLLLLFGCPNPNNNSNDGNNDKSDPQVKLSLTEQINADSKDVDFNKAVIAEDAEVNTAKKISNLNIGVKTLTINVSGVTLENVTAGKVVAGKGIGEGDLTINNCKIENLKVLGGGTNSIHVKGTTVKEVSVEKDDVRLHLEESTNIAAVKVAVNNVKIEAEATDANKAPKIESLRIEENVSSSDDTSNIQIKNAVITEVAVEKENVILNLAESTQIKAVKVAANNTSIQAEAADAGKAPVISSVKVEAKVAAVEVSGGTIEKIEVKTSDKSEAVPEIKITGAVEIKNIEQLDKDEKPVESPEVKVTVAEKAKEEVKLPEEIVPIVITVKSLVIDTTASIQSYKTGDAFNYNGIYAIYTYSDGSTKKVPLTSDNCTVEGFDSSKKGECAIKIEYKDGDNTAEKEIATRIELDGYEIVLKDFYAIHSWYNQDWDDYTNMMDITDYFGGVLPAQGEKVYLTYEGFSSNDIGKLYADLMYLDKNGIYQVLNEENDVLVAENVKAGDKISTTLTFVINKKVNNIYLQTFIFSQDYNGITLIDNNMSSENTHIKAEPCDEGVKFTIKTLPGESFYKDAGGRITVLGSDVNLSITNENVEAGLTEFIYPFTEKGKTYYFAFGDNIQRADGSTYWTTEYVKTTAGGGRDISDYANFDKFNAAKLTPEFNPDTKKFVFNFDSELKEPSDMFKVDKLTKAQIDFTLLLGEIDWAHSEWNGCNSIYFTGDNLYYYSASTYNNLKYEKENGIEVNWGKKESEVMSLFPEYDNHYCASTCAFFRLNDDKLKDYEYSSNTIWSELCVYDNPYVKESTKNIDIEDALKDGIKDVEKFIDSPETLFEAIKTSVDEYKALLKPAISVVEDGHFDNGDYGTVISSSVGTAKSAEEAYKQVSKIVKWYSDNKDTIKALYDEGKIDIDFDETIDIGELSLDEWIYALGKIYDEVATAIYGGVSINIPETWEEIIPAHEETECEWFPEEKVDENGKTIYADRENWREDTQTRMYGYYVGDWVEIPEQESYYFWEYGYSNAKWENYFDEETGETKYIYYGFKPNVINIPEQTILHTDWMYIPSFAENIESYNRDLEYGEPTFYEMVEILDKYISIKNLYLALKADIEVYDPSLPKELIGDVDMSSTGIDLDLGFNTKLGIVDINDLIAIIMGTDEELSLPVKAASIGLDLSAALKATKEQFANTVNILNSLSDEEYDDEEYEYNDEASDSSMLDLSEITVDNSEAKANIELKVAVCTKEKLGGIITVNATVATDDVVSFLLKLSECMYNGDESTGTDVNYPQIMKMLQDVTTLSVSVSDGTTETVLINSSEFSDKIVVEDWEN